MHDPDGKFDNRAIQMLYWKASNYLFTGSWPLAFGEEAIERSVTAANPFKSGVEANPAWSSQYFNVSFNNGTATAQLPGLFVTPDGSRPLPTVILTTGTDFTKEETFLQFGLEALARGYAVLAYDGPGQGAVLKNDPHMPFYAGVSLGGYLGTRGCADNSDRLAACVPNPPQFSVIPVYERFSQGLAQGVYGPLQFAAQTEPSSLPPG